MLHTVPKLIFNSYVRSKNLTKVQGPNFHSEEFLDSNGNVKAYTESSSYGAETVYQIDDNLYENFETYIFVQQLFNI